MIPRKIWQTFKSKDNLPTEMQYAVDHLRRLNPGYEYALFSDDDCRKYLNTHFGADYLNAFDALIPGAFKADLWRYACLVREGGVYVDIDFYAIVPLSTILHDEDDCVLVKDRADSGDFSIFQAFIAVRPQHPIMKASLDLCMQNIQNRFIGKNALDITGPRMMGQAMNRLLNPQKSDTSAFKPGLFTMNGIRFRMLRHSANDPLVLDEAGNKLFYTKYEGYTCAPWYLLSARGAIYHDQTSDELEPQTVRYVSSLENSNGHTHYRKVAPLSIILIVVVVVFLVVILVIVGVLGLKPVTENSVL